MPTIRTFFILAFSTVLCAIGRGQGKTDLFAKIDTLKKLLSRADTLNAFDELNDSIGDTITEVNSEISSRLADILTKPEITDQNLDSLLEHDFLGKVHSKDKRLWIFSWYENTGGSWKSNINLVHYRTISKKPKVDYDISGNENETGEKTGENVFCSNGAWFNKIYKLNSKQKDLYLCMGSGISCNTCVYEIATVIELTKDSINFIYPAFPAKNTEVYSPNSENQSCFTLDARFGDIEKFEFDPKTQTLKYTYLTDDNTPVRSVKHIRIIKKLFFDGGKFVGHP